MRIGDRLLTLLCDAEERVRIAAPFVKAHALERALLAIPDGIAVTCIARMRPEDIAAGVCDLEVFDLLGQRSGAKFLIHPHLHAKFFAADQLCLVGSANLSQTALGWRTPSNIELLVELNAADHGLDAWWDELLGHCIEASSEMRDALETESARLRDLGVPIPRTDIEQEAQADVIWVPECPRWTGLWEAYSGDEDRMPASALASAMSDLKALGLPPGLNQLGFEKTVRASFKNTQIYFEMDRLSEKGLTDLAAHELLVDVCGVTEADVERRWQLLKRWLSGLYPEEFRVETNQEILLKGKSF